MGSMKYEERLEIQRKGHRLLAKMQGVSMKNPELPPDVKREKLEAALERIRSEYVISFKKKEAGHA